MAVTVQSIVDDARVLSGLRNNSYFSDTQIASLVNDTQKELWDIFTAQVSGWFRSVLNFTLAGGTGANSVAMPTDLEWIQWLDLNLGSSRPATILELGSPAERNAVGGGLQGIGEGGRRYLASGDTLYILPADQSQGSYTMVYTRQAEDLVLTVTDPTTQRTTVPQILTPWVPFLKYGTAIAIRNAREQPSAADLEKKFAREHLRAVTMSKQRGEGVTQAPITRRWNWGMWPGGGGVSGW
jgi:hypothetical protein